MKPVPTSVVLAEPGCASLLQTLLPGSITCVATARDLIAAATDRSILFVDDDRLPELETDHAAIRGPVIAILDGKDALPNAIRALNNHPWLAHVITTPMLTSPRAKAHFGVLLERFVVGPEQSMLHTDGVGRVALLARASRREARFERMRDFFARQRLSERTIGTIIEVAEELVMNALYDAPVEAGYFKKPRQRSEDVELPPDRACEISYGIEDGTVFLRLRDPFGALSRARLVQVLNRCNTKAVALDESRGGAGLGLWRVFSVASTITITVIPGSRTEILVGFRTKEGRAVARQLDAIHLFFGSGNGDYDSISVSDDDGLVDHSITLVLVA